VTGWKDHLIIAPILLPLLAGALMILIGERRRNLQATLGLVSVAALLVVAIALLAVADSTGNTSTQVYRLGNWPSLFAIVLALDRLSALMLVLTAILGVAALVYSLARWHRAGAHFHPLFQFQLMGLNGAFLTGDLFNLFVFFEVMLAASYGLALHGSGAPRVRAGLHYIVVNLTASLLFLVGVSMLYGVAGTLNMADLAARIPAVAPEDRALVETGAAILGVAFLIKAAMWPLGFWLPTTYAAASAPAAAILSILSKVGIYAVLRLWLLLFGAAGGASAGFGGVWLLGGGLLSIAFGSVAVLATQNMARLAGSAVLVSSGTLLAAVGVGQIAVTSGALFYMASSVLAIAGFFLLTELIERGRDIGADMLAVTREAYGEDEEENPYKEETGVAIPATKAILGMSFMGCALVLAGLPPLSGFIAKLTILVPLFAGQGTVSVTTWVLLAALLLSGMAMIIAMTRSGIDAFWVSAGGPLPRVRMLEIGPVLVLLTLCVALSVKPAPVLRYMQAAAQSLHAPQHYVRDVLSDRGSQTSVLPPGGGR
jgi:multicomponent K+:H+ antiporter subunit D